MGNKCFVLLEGLEDDCPGHISCFCLFGSELSVTVLRLTRSTSALAPPRSHRRRRISFFQFRFILSMVSKGSHFKFMIDDSISGNQWHVSCGGGES
ncbi:hypothetical protein P8452_59909 [Trifolium repens]|nr:hypothetical protein P8452_59909 [Trifolium repens]